MGDGDGGMSSVRPVLSGETPIPRKSMAFVWMTVCIITGVINAWLGFGILLATSTAKTEIWMVFTALSVALIATAVSIAYVQGGFE